jgi:hypothetical protein
MSPRHTLKRLCDIFPRFSEVWADEQAPPEDGLVEGVYWEWTHHAVLMKFLEYFASNHDGFDEHQIRALCAWINDAVSVDGDLENAVSTCPGSRTSRPDSRGLHSA